jgi:hypothetical protein
MIAERWEAIESMRMPATPTNTAPPPWFMNLWQTKWGRSPPTDPRQWAQSWAAFDRLRKIRETMRMELPDRASDIRRPPTPGAGVSPIGAPPPQPSDAGIRYTANPRYYYNVVQRNKNPNWGDQFADAECLYMIISRMEVGESTGLEFFSQKEIGDKDRDGMPELWDPWGNPIRFIRWPTGFSEVGSARSSLQAVPNPNSSVPGTFPPFDRTLFPADALDPTDVDGGGFFHFSLIYSAGPDELSDVAHGPKNNSVWNPDQYATRGQGPNDANVDNPFVEFTGSDGKKWRIGGVNGDDNDSEDNSTDNIHNHLIETSTK